ncbi:MAG TPA: M1 family metallopeptidase [Candidatus Saccharimonadales bacterium]|nr:M1 family metallopeptidase [Candidatus Saccharimonadales bacterium]
MPKGVTRLFTQFQPAHYDLTLDLNDKDLLFSGLVKITGKKIGRPSKRLTLHSKDLVIKNAKLSYKTKNGMERIEIARINQQKSFDELRLHSDHLLYPGEYIVELEFSGEITKQMHGIYPCFFDHEGQSKKLIASQFESHHAREAFPCVDEPEAKATFDLTLITAKDQEVLANTPCRDQQVENSKLVSRFETSPLMSCYLLAFVSGEMHCAKAKTKDGIEVRSWASLAQPKSHLDFANQEAVKILEFFSEYFQTPFPLPKLDNVALPDFEVGAMENWGLITYRESALLTDPDNRSLSSEQYVSGVITHEISHQWFGNLVTMRWWNDLWLNESFASLMESVAEDKLHPEWQAWEDFTAGRVLACSHRDIYKDVQPVGLEVHHPDEIAAIFDPAIVYAKGARLLSMLVEYIGEDNFRAGLKTYFKKYAFGNTVGDDLWQELSGAAKQDIGSLMRPWIAQAGQPLVRLMAKPDKLTISQERFLMDGEDKTVWPIPLLSEPALPIEILKETEKTIDYDGQLPLLNARGNGHFVSYYEGKDSKELLKKQIVERKVGSSSRIILLSDMLLLARKGLYELTYLLDIVSNAKKEPRDAVWSMMARIVGQGQLLIDDDKDVEKHIRAYKASLASYWYEKLGWEDRPSDDANTRHLRTTALALSLSGEYEHAVDYALKLYDKTGNAADLPADQRALIVACVVKRAKKADIESLKNEYVRHHNPDVKMSIASGLCATRDTDLASSLIKWGLNEGGNVRAQDIATWFAYLMRNSYTRELTWEWFTNSWDYISELSGGGKYMDYFVWYTSGPLATEEWLAKFKKFFTPKLDDPALKRNILIAFSEIEARAIWRKREAKSLKKYFSSF